MNGIFFSQVRPIPEMLDLARRVISASGAAGSPPGQESGSHPAAVDNNTLSPIRGSSSKMHKVQPKKHISFFLSLFWNVGKSSCVASPTLE